jgi:hypothetical protein
MEPSSDCNVIALLNHSAELDVISFAAKSNPESDLAQQFRDQVVRTLVPISPITPGVFYPDTTWIKDPKFKVTQENEPAVLEAALAVLQEQSRVTATLHLLTRRHHAARKLAKWFGTPRGDRDWAVHGY